MAYDINRVISRLQDALNDVEGILVNLEEENTTLKSKNDELQEELDNKN